MRCFGYTFRARAILFSLCREGYQFEKIAVLDEKDWSLRTAALRVAFVCINPANGGSWYLWAERYRSPILGSETPSQNSKERGESVEKKLGSASFRAQIEMGVQSPNQMRS